MIRILAILLLALLVLGKTGDNLPVCNRQTISQALPPVIFAQQTIDGPTQPPPVTRFFHNKLGIAGSEIARCYFNVLDPVFIYQWLGMGGLVGFLYFCYNRLQKTVTSKATDECKKRLHTSEWLIGKPLHVFRALLNLKYNTEDFQPSEVYKILDRHSRLVIAYILILPFLPFFNLPLVTVILSYKVFAIIGLALALKSAKL